MTESFFQDCLEHTQFAKKVVGRRNRVAARRPQQSSVRGLFRFRTGSGPLSAQIYSA
jgi:hypothetical protein